MSSHPNNLYNSLSTIEKSTRASYTIISPFNCGRFFAVTISINFCFSPFRPQLTNFPNDHFTSFPIPRTAVSNLGSSSFSSEINNPANFAADFICKNVGATQNLHEIPRESLRKKGDKHDPEGVTNGGKMRIDEAVRRQTRINEITTKRNRKSR